MDKQLTTEVRRLRRKLTIMSVVVHALLVGLFFSLGTMGGFWVLCFVPAATMVVRGYTSSRTVYRIFSDATKAQKYSDQATKALS